MNSKFLKVLPVVAIALMAAAPFSLATKYTPATFNKALLKAVGKKTGAAAYNSAANFYKSALSDKANKSKAGSFATFVGKIIKNPKIVPIQLQGKAVNTCVNGLQLGYFKGLKYNINDTQYNKALTTLLNSMAGSQKVSLVVSTAIYKTYWSLAKKNGVPQQTYYDLFLAIARKTHINDTFNS